MRLAQHRRGRWEGIGQQCRRKSKRGDWANGPSGAKRANSYIASLGMATDALGSQVWSLNGATLLWSYGLESDGGRGTGYVGMGWQNVPRLTGT